MQSVPSRAHGYEMPSPLISSLVHRTTWQLYCAACDRRAWPNVVDMVERLGEIPAGYFYDRARCAVCGGRFAVSGLPLELLIARGELRALAVADGSSWCAPEFTTATLP